MTAILYLHFHQPLERGVFDAKLANLPEAIAEKIGRYLRWEDAHASLFGLLLLDYAAKRFDTSFSLAQLKRSYYGRPYFNNQIDFNISHSGSCVACAISDETTLGIDVEEIRAVHLEDFKHLFKNEWAEIQDSPDRLATFYKYWTQKESVIKADGRGFSAPIDDMNIMDATCLLEDKKYFLKSVDINSDRHVAHLASTRPSPNVSVKQYQVGDLIF